MMDITLEEKVVSSNNTSTNTNNNNSTEIPQDIKAPEITVENNSNNEQTQPIIISVEVDKSNEPQKSELNHMMTLTPPTTPNVNGTAGNIDPPSPMVSENLLEKLGASSQTSTTEGLQKSINRNNSREVNANRSSGGLDQHKYKTYFKSKASSHHARDDPLNTDLIQFPKDDLSINKTNQIHRTLQQNFNNETLSELNIHVKNSIESFLAPRKSIIRNYSKYRKDDKPQFEQDKYESDIIAKEKERAKEQEQQGSSPKIPMMKQKSGMFGSSSAGEDHLMLEDNDELHNEYLQGYNGDTDQLNQEQRKKGRLGLFKYYKPDYNWGSGTEVSLCNRTPVEMWQKRMHTNVLVEFKGLGFLLGEHEPFFCSMFLYDSLNKCRISETFHFDFNTEILKSLIYTNGSSSGSKSNLSSTLNKNDEEVDQYTQAKHVILSLPQKQDKDIWMVIKVNKIMQGNPEQAREPYMKLDEKETTKVKNKISGVIKDIGKRLGKYSQPFCVTAIQLTNESGQVRSSTPERCDLYKAIPKDISDLPDLIESLKEPSKKKKLKTLLGTMTINIFKPDNDLPNFLQRLDPSYDFVKASEPFNNFPQPSQPTPMASTGNLASMVPTITVHGSDGTSTTPPTPSSPGQIQRSQTSLISPVQSLNRVASSIGGIQTQGQVIQVIREIQCFSKNPELHPHHQLLNNLYIYPETVNLNKAHGRNICIKVEIRDNDLISMNGPLKYIYGKSSNQRFTNNYYTETHYHNKTPDFIDEIKIKLPVKLNQNLHLLFTFYHVICKVKKGVEEVENLIGFAVLPLYRDENFVGNGQHQLPLCIGTPKDKYLSNSDDYQLLENGKNVFKLDLKFNSTLYPQNRLINQFLLKSQNDYTVDKELIQILNDFNMIDPLEAIKFLPVIMNQLIYVICSPTRDPLVGCFAIKSLFILLTKIQDYLQDPNIRVPLLVQYIQYVFDNLKEAKTPVYSALCTRFVHFLMRRRDTTHDLSTVSISSIFSFTWFINDLIVKSLSLYQLEGNSVSSNGASVQVSNGSSTDSASTTPNGSTEDSESEFIRYLQKIITFNIHLIHNAISNSTQESKLASEANNNLALFIRDLFAVYDKGAIIDLVFTYINDINTAISKDHANSTTLIFYKFDFLRIITDYEHYINLNIPIPYSVHHIQNLSLKISDSHPISGVFQKEVLEILFNPTYSVEVRTVAFNALNTLLTKHEYDMRYQEQAKKERIAGIYFQLVLEIIDHFEKFSSWTTRADLIERRLFCSCVLYVLKNISRSLLKQWIQKEIPQRINVFFEVIEVLINVFEYQPASSQLSGNPLNRLIPNIPNIPTVVTSSQMSQSTPVEGIHSSLNNLTNIFTSSAPTPPPMFIGHSGKLSKDLFSQKKHKQSDSLISPLKDMISRTASNSQLAVDPQVLQNIQNATQNGGGSGSTTPSSPSIVINSGSNNSSENSSPTIAGSTLASHLSVAEQNRNKSPSISRPTPTSRGNMNESTLCTESQLIVLDFLELFIKTQYTSLVEPGSPVMDKLFGLFILLLKKRQSNRMTHCLFASLRSFVFKFRNYFFKITNNYCGNICYEILRYCNFPSKEIREVATALLYSMIRINSQDVGNFGRMKIQATISLSNLAKSNVFGNDFKNLERSFRALSKYSTEEAKPESTDNSIIPIKIQSENQPETNLKYKENFAQQIHKMSNKLSKIIRDTVRANILKANSDPETIHELYSEIASGYSDTPIIRIDWLKLLSNTHIGEENYFESAICMVRIALLVYAYLEQHNLLPCKLDLSLIQLFCPGLAEVVVEEDEGVCTSPIFSVKGLTESIYFAINQLRVGDFFEYSILLYKLLIPLYEKLRDFTSLSECHKQIHKLYKEIIRSNENKSRMLGRYYRVGFYGLKFDELNGKEFIYKEPKLTHLFALSDRLKTFYSKKFGEPVTIFPDSGKVDLQALDQDKLCLQITSLKPYFEASEMEFRPEYFERHTLLKRFVYITPFTLSGTGQGSITDQFHRKTILSIEHTAPNMLKRYPVVGRSEIEISPIENSIETIEIRNNQLTLEISLVPPNIKTLQGVLQGSVLLQVNAGAIEICRGFLMNSNRKNWPPHLVDKLAATCRKFLKLCEQALEINRNNILVINSFHQELESGYKKLYAKMARYIKGEINTEEDEKLLDEQLNSQNNPDMASFDDDSVTDFSYDERTEDSSIKEQTSILDHLSHLTPSFLKDQKKKSSNSGFLTIKEDKKKNRSSSEFIK
ncbi:DOCK family protein [Tieghemostelium lacteum]|uniref:DOCK family protein n=1 Tax=Tieghemostelium lacteum TaxID=361077 RepID=A0A152AAC3_TIELA|nr:DOCK family protein [Tieghemostelium lacteum]|eukprot:KYR03085.1 DOCK family protein [Tieghemostelium lacteum]